MKIFVLCSLIFISTNSMAGNFGWLKGSSLTANVGGIEWRKKNDENHARVLNFTFSTDYELERDKDQDFNGDDYVTERTSKYAATSINAGWRNYFPNKPTLYYQQTFGITARYRDVTSKRISPPTTSLSDTGDEQLLLGFQSNSWLGGEYFFSETFAIEAAVGIFFKYEDPDLKGDRKTRRVQAYVNSRFGLTAYW